MSSSSSRQQEEEDGLSSYCVLSPQQEDLRVVSERLAFALQLSVPRLSPQQQQSLAHTPCLSACPCVVFFLAPTRGRRWTLLLERCIRASCGATSTLYPKVETGGGTHGASLIVSSPLQEDTSWSYRLGSIHHCIKTHAVYLLVLFFLAQQEEEDGLFFAFPQQEDLRVVSERLAFALQLSVPRLSPQQQQSLAHTPCLSACPCVVFFLAPTGGRRWTLPRVETGCLSDTLSVQTLTGSA